MNRFKKKWLEEYIEQQTKDARYTAHYRLHELNKFVNGQLLKMDKDKEFLAIRMKLIQIANIATMAVSEFGVYENDILRAKYNGHMFQEHKNE